MVSASWSALDGRRQIRACSSGERELAGPGGKASRSGAVLMPVDVSSVVGSVSGVSQVSKHLSRGGDEGRVDRAVQTSLAQSAAMLVVASWASKSARTVGGGKKKVVA